jgi:hypothetical protein
MEIQFTCMTQSIISMEGMGFEPLTSSHEIIARIIIGLILIHYVFNV